jgi:glycosyltransferase involved in cell wall biosynthesis
VECGGKGCKMTNNAAIAHFLEARNNYLSQRFDLARASIEEYRKSVNYDLFAYQDGRQRNKGREIALSVIIVSYRRGQELIECIKSILKQSFSDDFEIILVDQGGNDDAHHILKKLPILWIRPPINLFPSEGRNLAAHFAVADILVMLDDDAIVTDEYLHNAAKSMAETEYIAVRGRVERKTELPTPLPNHYDLGTEKKPCELNLEGNMAIRREVFVKVNGFDPLLFGHEGKELGRRCKSQFPKGKIFYIPELRIKHDWASDQRLNEKRKRQALATEYLEYLDALPTGSKGISVLISPAPREAITEKFLDYLSVAEFTPKPEVILVTDSVGVNLDLSLKFSKSLFIRTIPNKPNSITKALERSVSEHAILVHVCEALIKELPSLSQKIRSILNTKDGKLVTKNLLIGPREYVKNNFSKTGVWTAVNAVDQLISRLRKRDSTDKSQSKGKIGVQTEAPNSESRAVQTRTKDERQTTRRSLQFLVNTADASPEQLESTICSITRQDCALPVEIVIFHTSECKKISATHILKLISSPWIQRLERVTVENHDDPQIILSRRETDFALALRAGDVLYRAAARLLVEKNIKTNADLTLAPAARKNKKGQFYVSEKIKSLFAQSECELYSRIKYLRLKEDTQLADSTIQLINQKRESIVDRTFKVAVVHDYLCIRKSQQPVPYIPSPISPFSTIVAPSRLRSIRASSRDRKQVWLFGEREGNSAEENSWLLFKYCHENYNAADCYYVINPNLEIPEFEDQSRILVKGSLEWHRKLGEATHLIFNNSAGDILEKASDANNLGDLIYIYLTHGVLSYSPGVYQRNHRYFDLVTVTSRRDIRQATRIWGMGPEVFRITGGLTRWDNLKKLKNTREILFCPTWRKSLPPHDWSGNDRLEDINLDPISGSTYFKRIESLLKNGHLTTFLEQNDLRLVVSAHFRVRKLLMRLAKTWGLKRVVIHDPENDKRNTQDLLKDASVLITDYSSVMWDMAFMHKPVILYQSDKAEILQERELDGFGIENIEDIFYVCTQEIQVINSLSEIHQNAFRLTKIQVSNLEEYLPIRDDQNCARTLDAILNFNKKLPSKRSPTGSKIHPIDISGVLRRIQSKRTASITGNYFSAALPKTIQALTPQNWVTTLESSAIDCLLIEPTYDSSCDWAEVFFDTEKLRSHLIMAIEICARKNIEIVWAITPYQHQIHIESMEHLQIPKIYINFRFPRPTEEVAISIIVPLFNGEKFLDQCIESLVNQDFAGEYEIILIDDDSSDRSEEVIKKWQANHSNIRYFWQPNSRQGMARNLGIHVSAGKYVTFVDADDIIPSHTLSILYDAIIQSDAEVSVGLMVSFNDANPVSQWISQSAAHFLYAPSTVNSEIWPALADDCSSVAKMISRQLIINTKNFFPKSFHEDQFFTSMLFKSTSKVAVCDKIVYYYRGHEKETGTQNFSLEKFRQILLIGLAIFRDFNSHPSLSKRYKERKFSHILARYDRFLRNYARSSKNKKEIEVDANLARLIINIISLVPLELTDQHAPNLARRLLTAFEVSSIKEDFRSALDWSLESENWLQRIRALLVSRRSSPGVSGNFDFFIPIRLK